MVTSLLILLAAACGFRVGHGPLRHPTPHYPDRWLLPEGRP